MLAVLIAMALTPSHRTEFWTSLLSMSLALLAFVAFKWLPRRRRQSQIPKLAIEERAAQARPQAPRA
jgi:hypothetical protein